MAGAGRKGAMQGVTHRTVPTNGISMHFVEMGSGPVVLFLHGFCDGWYGWRKQIPEIVKAGYRAIAPDMRGYGDTSAPEGVMNYTYLHIVGDLIGLLDALAVEKAYLVTHDWGSTIGWQLALYRPDRVIALAALSIYFFPRSPKGSILQLQKAAYGDGHYMNKFQIPGEMEAQIASITPEVFFKLVFGSKIDQGLDFMKMSPKEVLLPQWMPEEDLAYHVNEFKKHGFTPPLNYYRALDLSWELTAPWARSKVMVPAIFIIGDQDIVYQFDGAKDYIQSGMASDVPFLKEAIVLEGLNHFLQLEKPDVVNNHILHFFKEFDGECSVP